MMNRPCGKPTAIDLFAGAGGFSEGFIQAGFHVIASVESNPQVAKTQYLNHTYRKHYRTEVITADIADTSSVIEKLCATGADDVDVVMGGPPCQGYSRSNMCTRTMDNPNNRLFRKFIDVVAHFNPHLVVMENVADLATTFEKGTVADLIIEALKAVGYATEKAVLNAAHFGVPQYRNRVFFIGARDGLKIQFPEKLYSNPEEFVTVGEAISDLPELENGTSVDELPYLLEKPFNGYQRAMRKRNNGLVRNNLVTKNGELVLKRYKYIPQGGNWSNIPDHLMQNYADKARCHHWIYKRLLEDEPSVVISNYRKNMLIHPKQNRGLSVREAARLQSFPDHFMFLGGIGSQQQQVANAVPPLLARAVGRTVRRMLGR